MIHDTRPAPPAQAAAPLAATLRRRLVAFLRPFAHHLATRLDIRLVQTALDLVQVILTHRHRACGLLLSELGGYLLGPAHAPAGTKRIANLLHAAAWSAADLATVLFHHATDRVHALVAAGEDVLAVWDGSVWEKPERQACPDWCAVRSSKARRLARRRKRLTAPPSGPPILVPGLHWDGVIVLGMQGPPTLATVAWWTTRGPHATTQRDVAQTMLATCAQAWGRQVCHVWDRGYAGSPWVQAALTAGVRFIVRWKKGVMLLDNWGEPRKAWEIARGKRTQGYRMLWDPQAKERVKVGVVAIPVTLVDHPHPMWLVVARLGGGRAPWYLLSNEPIRTLADAWAVVRAYARRWQIEVVWRVSKSELAFESVRVQTWEARLKLLLLATLAYAFLLHLLETASAAFQAEVLRQGCHRTGERYQQVAMPIYRLRAAMSWIWQRVAPPGLHQPTLNSG